MIKTFNLHLGNRWDLPTVDKETLQCYHNELISVVGWLLRRRNITFPKDVKSPRVQRQWLINQIKRGTAWFLDEFFRFNFHFRFR